MAETPYRNENNNVHTIYWPSVSPNFFVGIPGFSNIYVNADEVSMSNNDFEPFEVVSDGLFGDRLETVVEQLETEVPNKPTSKAVVEKLTIVTVTNDEVKNNNAMCAICNDNMGVGEKAKLLPCLHRYHGGCIDQWLGTRNTCPVCRYVLPIDDPESEGSNAGTTNFSREVPE